MHGHLSHAPSIFSASSSRLLVDAEQLPFALFFLESICSPVPRETFLYPIAPCIYTMPSEDEHSTSLTEVEVGSTVVSDAALGLAVYGLYYAAQSLGWAWFCKVCTQAVVLA